MAYKDRHNIARRTRNPQSDTRLSFVQLESVLKVTTHEYHQPTCMCNNMYKRDTNNQHVCVHQHVQERETDFTHPPNFWPRSPHFTHLSQIQSSGGVTTVDRCKREQRENRERTEREQRGNRERTERDQRENRNRTERE